MSYNFFLKEFQKCGTFEELERTAEYWQAKLNAEFVDKNHPELRENLCALESAYKEARVQLPSWLQERKQVEEEMEEQDRDD